MRSCFQGADVGDGGIGEKFGGLQIEVLDIAERTDLLHAGIGDEGEGEVEGLELGERSEVRDVPVGDPGVIEADGGGGVGGSGDSEDECRHECRHGTLRACATTKGQRLEAG